MPIKMPFSDATLKKIMPDIFKGNIHGWKNGNCEHCDTDTLLACFILDDVAHHMCEECVWSKYRVRL
jgi:hypothetical protein